jgi:hypothetical protein
MSKRQCVLTLTLVLILLSWANPPTDHPERLFGISCVNLRDLHRLNENASLRQPINSNRGLFLYSLYKIRLGVALHRSFHTF